MSEHSDPADPKPPAEDLLSLLWRRISDHRLVQWSVAYVALAYGIQHGVTLTAEAFDWPHAVERISMLLLALGLPVAMTLAWYHGARASRQFSHAELSIISLLLVIGAGLFYVFARPSEEIATGPALTVKTQAIAGAPGSTTTAGISIAVLPFANLSGDVGQDFFSDGMTEEIAGALAKVPDLHLVARSSAFEFKGRDKEARAVGQALGATHLIEGSVRKAGNRVRISAQLVRADNGLQLWTENYDRELTDIFATQEDIAQAIAGALKVPLGLKQGETLISNRAVDTESYQNHLRAKALFRARAVDEAIKIWEPVVARDPDYAPAWALLASAYALAPNYTRATRSSPIEEGHTIVQAYLDKSEAAARKAMQLDSRNAEGYASLAYIQYLRNKWAEAEELYRHALMLDPNDPDVLNGYSVFLTAVGRFKDAMGIREKLRTLEPFVPVYNVNTAGTMFYTGEYAASITMLEAIPADAAGGLQRSVFLAHAYAALGRYDQAADTILLIRSNLVSRQSVEEAARLIRAAPAKVKAPETLPVLEGNLNFVYAYIGALPRIIEFSERTSKVGYGTDTFSLWVPEAAPIRQTERFRTYVRKAGLVDYWRARGWPDLCRPVGADDFACE